MGSILNILLIEFGAVVLGLFVAVYVFLYIRYKYWKTQNIPYKKPSFPFGTSAATVLGWQNLGTEHRRTYNEFIGLPYVGLFFVHRPTLLIRDLGIISQILVKDFQHFHGRGIVFDEENDPLGAHLFNLEGYKWKSIRNKLSPTFTSGKMKMMFPTMMECADQLREYMNEVSEGGGQFEARELAARFTTDVIAACAFGIKCNCLKDPDAEFRYWGRKAFQPTKLQQMRGFVTFFLPAIAKYLKIKGIDSDVGDFFMRIVKETIHEREASLIKSKDFMQLLIELRKEGNNKDQILTTEEAAAQAFIFYLAGFETSSSVISFGLYLLALNSEIQAKLIKELDEIIRKNGNITYEALQEAHYLDQVVNETLRMYPPVSTLLRQCNEDYTIPGTNHVLKKGVDIVVPVEALHYDSTYFPNPEKFDPDRFSSERKREIPNYAFLPFGDGPRNCIGMRFGLMQVKLGLTMLLTNFKIQQYNKTEVPIELNPLSFFPFAKNGVWLKCVKRSHED